LQCVFTVSSMAIFDKTDTSPEVHRLHRLSNEERWDRALSGNYPEDQLPPRKRSLPTPGEFYHEITQRPEVRRVLKRLAE
jgi:hypothetical protein